MLGNHDLHFLSIALSIKSPSKKDTLSKVLSSPRLSLFVEWLISTPLIQKNLNYVMSHAGLHPSWSLNKAIELSNSFCESLYKDPEHTLKSMYGNEPKYWSNDLNKRDPITFLSKIWAKSMYEKGIEKSKENYAKSEHNG